MGIAGSGKGTQGQLLAESLGYRFLSTGELLRSYGSEDQHARMLAGQYLGDEEVTALLDRALREMPEQNKTIVDGYPRTTGQADWLLAGQRQGRFRLEGVVHLVASRAAVKVRLFERARVDDHDEAIEARFNEYEQATRPVLAHLAAAQISVTEIDAEQPIDAIHTQIIQIVDTLA